ncbi:dipeptidase [Skermanella pratensis]|uniref:dipeptidase n=1 Tax=Skermanella pratensis TaxID=2233999 RepID=UPI0013011C10|nr:dipeptidase [Skermanella pratensis]
MLSVAPVLDHLDHDFDAAVGRLCDLLRIRSVSTDPAYAGETRQAAQWLAGQLTGMGFEASLRDTPGHPMVVAHHPGPENATGPHLLYYGHYDVQPPEPLELWNSPPFEPTVVDARHGKRVVARGAVDDKGQVMTFIEAFRAWHAVHGTMPARITVLLEGEEETGSPNLVPFLEANKAELDADVCVVTDTNSWNIETPAITYMLRGMLYLEVTLHGPSHDLHSGMYGGAVLNPNNALVRILGQIHDEAGRVQFPGFYDDVVPLTEAEREQWRGLGFEEAGFLAGVGLKTPRGEEGWSTLERVWARPTCDINGIWGGYTGAGSKTVIPAHASAKFSCRLVAGQDPKRILAGIREFLDARTPADCRWEIKTFGNSPAIKVPAEQPLMRKAMAGLADIYGKPPVLIGSGGSIPVVGYIQRILGFDSILVGFGLEDDLIHSPNEKFELKCYRNGMRSHAAILARMAEV